MKWPNGVDKEPRGPAKPLHFYNQLKKEFQINVDVPPLKVIQVALNLGQAEAHGILEKDKYGFYDYIRIVDQWMRKLMINVVILKFLII